MSPGLISVLYNSHFPTFNFVTASTIFDLRLKVRPISAGKKIISFSLELCNHIDTTQQKPMHRYIINISLPNLEKTKFVFV